MNMFRSNSNSNNSGNDIKKDLGFIILIKYKNFLISQYHNEEKNLSNQEKQKKRAMSGERKLKRAKKKH